MKEYKKSIVINYDELSTIYDDETSTINLQNV